MANWVRRVPVLHIPAKLNSAAGVPIRLSRNLHRDDRSQSTKASCYPTREMIAPNSHDTQIAGAKKSPKGTLVFLVIPWRRAAAISTNAKADKAAMSTAMAALIQSSHNPATAASLASPSPSPS